MTSVVKFFCVSLVIFYANFLCARSSDALHLRGIKSVSIIVEGFETKQCELTADDLKTSVEFILGQSSITIKDHWPIAVYVNVTLIDSCDASTCSA